MTEQERIANKIAFVAERVRRRSYSPEDVRRALFGLPIDQSIVISLMKAAADRKPERPVYPEFTTAPRRPRPLPKPKEEYAIIVFSKVAEYVERSDTGKRESLGHTYRGAWRNENRYFVKSFTGKDIEFTREEKEALKFHDDKQCDACMAKLIMEHKVYTIAIWDNGSECVHYPNEHWWRNDTLQPSFINRDGVGDFYNENIRFDIRKGWIEHKWEDNEK